MPDGNNPYLRENFQRNCITRGLKKSSPDDLILISDLDEIPNPKVLNKFKLDMKFAVFKQMHFYYKFNMHSTVNPFWYGSRICVKKYLKSPQWLRDLKFKKRPFWRIDKFRLNNIIENGGWHFCNLKSPDELLYKYQNLCETNDPYIFNEKIDLKYLDVEEIKKKIILGDDIIGRNEKYKVIEINENFPDFIKKNKDKYKNWII
jgi:beta-1,4-mannosyl-glycoprotein beta-1,4-N-acetylglucosaminyltransferase